MKKKEISHPRIYLRILKKKDFTIITEYKDNKFHENGSRMIKKCELRLDSSDNLSNDFSEILNKLNGRELEKTINYIKVQYKVLHYHMKNNNYDAVNTVKESIKIMENFQEELNVL